MSDYIYVSLKVGGTLPASLIPEFVACVNGDIALPDDNKELTAKDLKGLTEPLKFYGQANYGMCTNTKEFCMEHGLSFVGHADSSGEYDADTTYYIPGMDDVESYKTDQNCNTVVRLDQVKPLFDLMLALAEQDLKALPKFLNNPAVADLVKDCLDKPQDIIQHLKQRINEVLPREAPELPALIIDKTK